MVKFLIMRLVSSIFVLFIVITITFFISHLLPGDPTYLWVGDHPTEEQMVRAKKELGLDRSVIEQYVSFCSNIVTLDFGISIRTRQPVLFELKNRLAATFELVTVSLSTAMFLGCLLGFVAAIKQNTRRDHFIRAFGYAGLSFPVFWLGMVLQLFFFGVLDWFPLQGRHSGLVDTEGANQSRFLLLDSLLSGNLALFYDALRHVFLPAFTMTLGALGVIIKTARSSMIEAISEPFFKTYSSYGFSPLETVMHSAYKNTLMPIFTIAGLSFGTMLGGTFLVESIFDWPGLGHFSVLSVLTNDFPSIMGVTILYTLTYIIINLFIDLAYFMIDPRIQN